VAIVLERIEELDPVLRLAGRGGIRDALRRSSVLRNLVSHPRVSAVVAEVLGPHAFAVRGVLFDKHSAANWKVPWHQDLTIAVRRVVPADGYGQWSVKAGIPHVRPPRQVLDGMLTVRVHLDTCDVSDGPLRVLPGSHRYGRLNDAEVASCSRSIDPVVCSVPRGGLLVMRPLLVHASSAATKPRRRRVLHIDFASCELPAGVEWSEQWPCARLTDHGCRRTLAFAALASQALGNAADAGVEPTGA
jgi:ectoine hydroxylase-related dioxygenase (phytanoyl-CoA dioxygenase family)